MKVLSRLSLVILAAALFIPAAALAQKRAFTIEDYYRLKPISDIQASLPGTLAFKVTTWDLPKAEKSSAIWIMAPDGKELRKVTAGEKSDYSPRWSPDGKRLAFLSSRDEDTGLYVLPMAGGEAKKILTLSTGISDPTWMPDGKALLFVSRVFPECEKAEDIVSCNEDRLEDLKEGPSQAHVADKLLYRHWDHWRDGRYRHVLKVEMDGKVQDLTPGRWDSPHFSLHSSGNYTISPDGKTLVVASKRIPNPAESTNSDLIAIDLATKEMKSTSLTSNPAADTHPHFSPDGRYLAYLTQKTANYESDLWRLAVMDMITGKSRLLTDTASFDYWVDDFSWSPNGKTIYFSSQVKGDAPLYSVTLQTGKIQPAVNHQTIGSFALTPDGKRITYVHRSIGEPWEIYRKEPGGTAPAEQLTFFNKKIADEVDIRPAERIKVKGAGGHLVDTFIVKPHGFDPHKKYPVIINVHGGPQGQWQDSFRGDWQMYPGAGYLLAFPNPHGSTGYGQAYTAEISGDWGGMVYEDVMKVADAVAALPYADADRMGVMGWSYGGYMMNWLQGHTKRFRCIASMMGVYDLRSMYGATEELWFPEWDLKGLPWTSEQFKTFSPSNYVTRFSTPMLVITGEKDFRVPYTQSLELFTDLQKMHVPSRLVVFKNSGHWPNWTDMVLYYTAHLEWFHQWLGGDPPPWTTHDFAANRVFDTDTGKRLDTGQ